jgi:hypothetical protein
MPAGSEVVQRLGRLVLAAFYVAPWAWLACFAVFVAAVTVKVGHFPSYSNPDPKHVEGLGALYELTVLLLFAAWLSPIVGGGYLARALLFGRSLNFRLTTAAIYVAGLGITSILLFGNAFGLANWLFD